MENSLIVFELPPSLKHPTIFARFDELEEGETVTIINDHDPKPLYYQFLAQRGNVFNWQYVEQGPEIWRVRIRKRIRDELDETIGELAAKDLRKVEVFRKYSLDFCCGGKKTVKEACEEQGLDVTRIEQELQIMDESEMVAALPPELWKPDLLCDYIVETHHSYVRKTLPVLVEYGNKVSSVHSQAHPELKKVAELICRIDSEMSTHMLKEERVVFPWIKNLVSNSLVNDFSAPDSVNEPIALMEMEHEVVGAAMHEIRQLTAGYALPADACTTYRLLFDKLVEFENDLHTHVHLENNILFVEAARIEKLKYGNQETN